MRKLIGWSFRHPSWSSAAIATKYTMAFWLHVCVSGVVVLVMYVGSHVMVVMYYVGTVLAVDLAIPLFAYGLKMLSQWCEGVCGRMGRLLSERSARRADGDAAVGERGGVELRVL